jgi:hypothetical protein
MMARATLRSRSSVYEEAAAEWLASVMFYRPERAACTIWPTNRERGSKNFSRNR